MKLQEYRVWHFYKHRIFKLCDFKVKFLMVENLFYSCIRFKYLGFVLLIFNPCIQNKDSTSLKYASPLFSDTERQSRVDCAWTGIVYENSLRRLTTALTVGYRASEPAWRVLLNKYVGHFTWFTVRRKAMMIMEKGRSIPNNARDWNCNCSSSLNPYFTCSLTSKMGFVKIRWDFTESVAC